MKKSYGFKTEEFEAKDGKSFRTVHSVDSESEVESVDWSPKPHWDMFLDKIPIRLIKEIGLAVASKQSDYQDKKYRLKDCPISHYESAGVK